MRISTNNASVEFSPNATVYLKKYHIQAASFNIITDSWLCGPALNVIVDKNDPMVNKARDCGQIITPYGKNENKLCIFRGAYPAGFWNRFKSAFKNYMPEKPSLILHVCAGSIPKHEGDTLDISQLFDPTYLCDAESIIETFPHLKEKYNLVISDTPYNTQAAEKYWDKPMISRSKILKQMNEVCQVGGMIAVFDESFPHNPKNLQVVARISVSSVPNLTFRALTVFRKVESL